MIYKNSVEISNEEEIANDDMEIDLFFEDRNEKNADKDSK